jgi:hypothetical protein
MPTQLIKKYIEELARWLRNDDSYDDWEVGMEPIPGDVTWTTKKQGSYSCKIKDNK